MQTHAPALRSLYRRLLRELPRRQPSVLANPSPIQHRIRANFSSSAATPSAQTHSDTDGDVVVARMQEAEMYIEYLRAQRTYNTLVERYNPGMNMIEEDRVRLSARRVGIDLPVAAPGSEGSGQKR